LLNPAATGQAGPMGEGRRLPLPIDR